MATAAFQDSASAQLRFPLGTAALLWASTITMHVSRPKSAKGQRPSLSRCQGTEACPCHVPCSPLAASPRELVKSQRAPLTKAAFPPAQVSPGKIPKLLQQMPLKTSSSSLNKYRVLPSISQKGTGSSAVEALAERTNRLEVSEEQEGAPKAIKPFSGGQGSASTLSGSGIPTEESSHVRCAPEQWGRQVRQESPWVLPTSLEEPHVLLAVRSPSGQRFEHHFKPSDSLQTVLAVAGQKLLANYQHCSVETMEVPRRSFSDLTKSLQECRILPKSVLCIRQDEQHDAADL
ncbi:UBX domain-containing protein 10 [Haemorhous mexicanus]|uniref:UBX domain-containing protein 10 n=1 Tax=Haemorhous mexicanus TaxID=30427 RepID=UPI0028BDC68C|nr:UBX domain-containing protein 10 [Haemorhous mexicanus]XP_059722515.1 UBX domain-containing protein 10 [Haemorhous mexicanus]XP_059722516.1 UBX domain-containing protein 10 [Haemorhous mexicanus]